MTKKARNAKGGNQYATFKMSEGEQRLRDRFNADMSYWRRTNQHISPAVGSTTLSDWLD